MMTNKKRVIIALSVLIIVGIICGALFSSLNFDVLSVAGDPAQIITSQEDLHERLLEYADYGLIYDADTKTFHYEEQLVKKITDEKHYAHANSDGTVQVSVKRDGDGKITSFNVK